MKIQRKTFGEMFPLGICILCKQPCEKEARVHYQCAMAYEDKKREVLKEMRE